MTIHDRCLIATASQRDASWSIVITNLGNNFLARLIFDTAFALQSRELPFGATETWSKAEDPMVAKGTALDGPRPKAAEFVTHIRQIANDRNEAAFEILFRYFAPRIKSYCLKLGSDASGAEEITQEAMVSIWRNAAQFDPSKASPSTWIFTIARNLTIDRFRKTRRPQFDPNDPALVPEDEPTPGRLIEQTEKQENVRKIMDTLSANERAVLMLSFYENLSHGDISKQLHIPLGTVKSRIRLAFTKIRSTLDAQDGANR
jgi:RNA polymerase sigma-70 factor (ECF subfamily)